MKPTFSIACVITLLLSIEAQAQNTIEKRFEQLDRNGDGRLSEAELQTSPQVQASLRGADTNQNGFLSRDEVRQHFTPKASPPTVKSAVDGGLFRRIDIPGFSDIVEGTNGLALADLNHDGLVDIVATYTEPNRGLSNTGHRLRVFINQGNFRFQMHPITIRESKLTCENFGPFPQIPNLADFNADGLLDIFITRHSPFWAGKPWPGMEPIGNTLLLSDGAWDAFRDVSAKSGVRNETAYN
nr:FG-GAP-like repeat-containing protein [Pirellulaceae bacterium]